MSFKTKANYIKAINIDLKNVVILKSDDADLLEEANQVLMNYLKQKNSTTSQNLMIFDDYKFNKKNIKYDLDFLMQFQDKQYELGTDVKNLIKLLQIQRDDYLNYGQQNGQTNYLTVSKNLNSSNSSFQNIRNSFESRSSVESGRGSIESNRSFVESNTSSSERNSCDNNFIDKPVLKNYDRLKNLPILIINGENEVHKDDLVDGNSNGQMKSSAFDYNGLGNEEEFKNSLNARSTDLINCSEQKENKKVPNGQFSSKSQAQVHLDIDIIAPARIITKVKFFKIDFLNYD